MSNFDSESQFAGGKSPLPVGSPVFNKTMGPTTSIGNQ